MMNILAFTTFLQSILYLIRRWESVFRVSRDEADLGKVAEKQHSFTLLSADVSLHDIITGIGLD